MPLSTWATITAKLPVVSAHVSGAPISRSAHCSANFGSFGVTAIITRGSSAWDAGGGFSDVAREGRFMREWRRPTRSITTLSVPQDAPGGARDAASYGIRADKRYL